MPQLLLPNSDVLVGGWSPTPLFAQIDTASPQDSTFITSFSNPTNQECRVGLPTPDVPQVKTGHIVRYRYAKSESGGRQIDIVVRLLDRSTPTPTVIATWTHTNVTDVVTQQNQTLTEAQANNIQSYAHLTLAFIGNAVGGGGGRSARIFWGQMEVPDAATNIKIVTSHVRRIHGQVIVERPPLFTNFSEYTTGLQPHDWSQHWVTTDQTWAVREKTGTDGGKVVEQTATTGARRFLRWDKPGATLADVEVVSRVRNNDVSNFVTQNSLLARASGTATLSTQNGYQCRIQPIETTWYLQLVEFKSGTATLLTNPGHNLSARGYTGGQWLWIRFRVIGNVLQGRAWFDHETEPEAWHLTFTDTVNPISSGGIGLSCFSALGGPRDFDVFGVGFDGQTAPTAAAQQVERTVTSHVRQIHGQAVAERKKAETVTSYVATIFSEAEAAQVGDVTVTNYVDEIHAEAEHEGAGLRTVTAHARRIHSNAISARTYYTDFHEYDLNVQPHDWTIRWRAQNSQWLVREKLGIDASFDTVLEFFATETSRRLITWNVVPLERDIEVASRVRVQNVAIGQARLHVRGAGGPDTEHGYFAVISAGGLLRLVMYYEGTTELLAEVPFFYDAEEFVFMRFRAMGNRLQVRAWHDGETEPMDWAIDITNNLIQTPGWAGLGMFNHESGLVDFDQVGFGTNGATAPLFAVSTVERIATSHVAAIHSEAEREGSSERTLTAYVGEIHSQAVGQVPQAVESYVDTIFSEAETERQKFNTVAAFVRVIHAQVLREGAGEHEVDSYVAAIHSEATASAERIITSYVVAIHSEVERLGAGLREVLSHMDEIRSEAERQGSGERDVDAFVTALFSEVILQYVATLTSYVQAIMAEVERAGSGERTVTGYAGEIHSDAQISVDLTVTSFIDAIIAEAERMGEGERLVEAFVKTVFTEAESELSGEETVTSYVRTVFSQALRQGNGDRTVTSFVDAIVTQAQITVTPQPESYVAQIDCEVERAGSGERTLMAHVAIILALTLREAKKIETVEIFVAHVFATTARNGAGNRITFSHTNALHSKAESVRKTTRTVTAYVATIFAESDRQAQEIAIVTSFVSRIVTQAFVGELPPFQEFDIDLGELVSDRIFSLGELSSVRVFDLGTLVSGRFFDLGVLFHAGE